MREIRSHGRIGGLVLVAILCSLGLVWAEEIEVGRTPPMGWNSWNHFACKVSDAIVRAQADALVSTGMKAAGYVYVNIDDCWQGKRNAQGIIQSNERFPDMKALGDYIHSKGLKFGIYSSPGPKTCGGYEGSLGREEQDAQTYAAWGVDYLKYDKCSFKGGREATIAAYQKMHDALLRTGRPIFYSLCEYGLDRVWTWGASVSGNSWRTTDDIQDNYRSMANIGFSQSGLERFAGPGHWNDPDMLEIGNGGMTTDEYRAHMSLWCLLAAPLLAGNDLTRMTPEALAILTNREVIAVDQDPLGVQAYRAAQEGPLEVWARPLADGSKAVGLFNHGVGELLITLSFRDIGVGDTASVRDLCAQKDLGTYKENFPATVPSHAVVMLKVK
jgi:alpha-galactosidase